MINEKCIVSVCCVTYNHENYIAQTIEGILGQKVNFDIEVLIHDDASTDQTPNIVRQYAKMDSRIVPVLRTSNLKSTGVSIFPILYKMANGKYIALCEGDDYWTDPFKLQKQVDFLENNSDVSICFHRVNLLKNGIYSLHKIPENIENKIFSFIELLKHYNFISTASVLFRKPENFIIPAWFSKLPFGDLGLYQLITSDSKKIYCLKEIMSVYRIHDKGMWSGLTQLDAHKKYLIFYHTIYKALNYEEKKVVSQKIKDINLKISKLKFPANRLYQKIYGGYLSLKFY